MNCAAHTTTPATAICTTCGKALCTECQVPTENAITCSSSCAAIALEKDHVHREQLKKIQRAAQSQQLVLYTSMATAVLFILFAIFLYRQMPHSFLPPFVAAFGAVSLFSSFLKLYKSRATPTNKEETSSDSLSS